MTAKFTKGTVEVRSTEIKRPTFTGTVLEHHHGDGRWHWVQDKHGGKYEGAHDKLGQPVFAKGITAEQKELYALILAGKVDRTPIRKQNRKAAVKGLTLEEELAELKAMDALVLGEADMAEEAAFLA